MDILVHRVCADGCTGLPVFSLSSSFRQVVSPRHGGLQDDPCPCMCESHLALVHYGPWNDPLKGPGVSPSILRILLPNITHKSARGLIISLEPLPNLNRERGDQILL